MGQISTRSHLYRHRADCHSRHLLNLERERPGTNPVLRQKTLSSVLGFGAREMIHELYNKVTLYVGFKALGFVFLRALFQGLEFRVLRLVFTAAGNFVSTYGWSRSASAGRSNRNYTGQQGVYYRGLNNHQDYFGGSLS